MAMHIPGALAAILVLATFCHGDVVIQDVLWTKNYEDAVGENYFGECRFVQSPCTQSNVFYPEEPINGVCLQIGQCASKGGTIIDSCQQGFGECCKIIQSCGNTTEVNVEKLVTVLQSHNYSTQPCSFKFRKEPQICQIRLDFFDFESASANAHGDCVTDKLTIFNSITADNFTTCGSLTGQHMYLAFGHEDVIEVVAMLQNTSSKYTIVATKIPCHSRDLAPDYCLQYFIEPNGNVSSFDFGGQQQNNQRYNLCVKPYSQSGSIKWTPCANSQSSFDITSAIESETPLECKYDWVQVSGTEKQCNRFATQFTSWKPYNLLVNFNSLEVVDIFSLLGISPLPTPTNLEECERFCVGSNNFMSFSCNPTDNSCIISPTEVLMQILANYPLDLHNRGFCLEYRQNGANLNTTLQP